MDAPASVGERVERRSRADVVLEAPESQSMLSRNFAFSILEEKEEMR
jgi:hypothetical protein